LSRIVRFEVSVESQHNEVDEQNKKKWSFRTNKRSLCDPEVVGIEALEKPPIEATSAKRTYRRASKKQEKIRSCRHVPCERRDGSQITAGFTCLSGMTS
jgi:hypothetical protein